MPVVTSTVKASPVCTLSMRQMRGPASVRISSLSPACEPRVSAIHAATQRVPLPLISATEPSALCRRMRPDLGRRVRDPGPGEEFDAVGADAGVALAKAARELGAIKILRSVFFDDQKIVAAGVGLGEGNQSSSQLHDKGSGFRCQVSGGALGVKTGGRAGVRILVSRGQNPERRVLSCGERWKTIVEE